ncbi:hypothetical protein PUN28_016494 [Cardiocondyla obscurior]
MLVLLNTNNKTFLPIKTLSSSLKEDVIQNPAMVHETSLSSEEPTNYVGLLNEFCQKQRIEGVIYQFTNGWINTDMPFRVEVSIGSFKEVGVGRCKQSAKQQAAKKICERIKLNQTYDTKKIDDIEVLKNTMQKLGVEILDSINEKKIGEQIEKRGVSLYLEHKKKAVQSTDMSVVKNVHLLFEKNYSTKISHNLKEKMRTIKTKGFVDQIDFIEIEQSIKNVFKVEIKEKRVRKVNDDYLICLQLLSNPPITQIGIGKINSIAKFNAMYDLISIIMLFLNI